MLNTREGDFPRTVVGAFPICPGNFQIKWGIRREKEDAVNFRLSIMLMWFARGGLSLWMTLIRGEVMATTELNEENFSALANICRVAAARFKEHAEHVAELGGRDSPYERLRQTFVDHMRQAEDFAEAFEDRTSRFALEAADLASGKSAMEEIMSLVESYAEAKRRTWDSDRNTYAAAKAEADKVRRELESALVQILSHDPEAEPEAVSAFKP